MPDYSFRLATHGDLSMLAEWLQHPQVAEWWGDPAEQLGLITEDLDNPAMTQHIVLCDATPIAYAQTYHAHAWSAPHVADLPQGTIAIDTFAAPAGFGQGGVWLRVLGDMLLQDAPLLAIDPDPQNTRAIRAYQKAGFAGFDIRRDGDGHPCRLMTRRR